jgi:hypothetical protein
VSFTGGCKKAMARDLQTEHLTVTEGRLEFLLSGKEII